MFCPSCGKQNKENVLFCEYCGKAMPQKASPPKPTIQPVTYAISNPQNPPAPKSRISFNAIKALVTVALIAVIAIVIIQIYYPRILPW
jgi:uncharacterized membrane protein YvbJ